jgi:hypothetical protein
MQNISIKKVASVYRKRWGAILELGNMLFEQG